MELDLRAHKLGATVRLAVRPGARETAALGAHDGALRLAVAAPPERGRANREALRWLSRALGLPAARVELLAGAGARHKVTLCRGVSVESLRARLAPLLPAEAKGE